MYASAGGFVGTDGQIASKSTNIGLSKPTSTCINERIKDKWVGAAADAAAIFPLVRVDMGLIWASKL